MNYSSLSNLPWGRHSRATWENDAFQARQNDYFAAHPKTIAGLSRARKVMSGAAWQVPYESPITPLMVESAEGSRLWDVDGHRYLDCDMGYGAAILGHRVPAVAEALNTAIGRGLSTGQFFDAQVHLAEIILSVNPHADRVLFFNTGSDAVTAAVRLTRARTGKQTVVRFDGCYHGWHDLLLFNTTPVLTGRSVAEESPIALRPSTAGVGESPDMLVLPYGNAAALRELETRREGIASILLNPFPPFMWEHLERSAEFVRQVTAAGAALGIPVIFDEIGSGFRLSPGGAQALFDVKADLVCYAKLTSGAGLALSVIAGRGEFLDLARLGSSNDSVKAWVHSTHAGSFLPVVAAIAQLTQLLSNFEAVARHRSAVYEQARHGVDALSRRLGYPLQLRGHPAMHGTLTLSAEPISRGQNVTKGAAFAKSATWYSRFAGLHMRAMPTLQLSYAHSESDVDETLGLIEAAVHMMSTDGLLDMMMNSRDST